MVPQISTKHTIFFDIKSLNVKKTLHVTLDIEFNKMKIIDTKWVIRNQIEGQSIQWQTEKVQNTYRKIMIEQHALT
jgi:hypothetical protein